MTTAVRAGGRHVTPRDTELSYELAGSGPTIAVVGSFFMPAAGWGVFTRELVARNRVLTYDLGPQGWSRAEVASFDDCVSDLDDLLDVLEVESTYLLGHSSGTQICVAYAAAHPERVRGLVLAGPLVNPRGGVRRRELVAAWRAAYLEGGFGGLFDSLWWLAYSEATLERAGRMGQRIMRGRFVAMNEGTNPLPLFALSDTHQTAFAPDWQAIAAPTLLLAGEDDCVSTSSGLRETLELLPRAELVRVPRAGHLVYAEAPETFQEEVQRFVDGVEAQALTP